MAYNRGDLEIFIGDLIEDGYDITTEKSYGDTAYIIYSRYDDTLEMVVREKNNNIQILIDDPTDIWNSIWKNYSWEKFKKEMEKNY